ncbi:MAG: hypothetical protein Q4E61_03045 [Alphaproteobacteria bacterium]|nr:hypothetical protein [Alphaproteobacteria bacterium]
MKEDIFFRVGYTTYLQKSKKKNWTSKIVENIMAHKFIVTILMVIIMCVIMNFWLIHKFIYVLEMSRVI